MINERNESCNTSKYQVEIDSFKRVFSRFKDHKIVLYGIGRYTATLVPAIKEFHIVGLMDRDENNIGKEIYGVPVISKEEAERIADLIIINTAETYWRIIYKRISELSIPIYFLNGENAVEQVADCPYQDNPYWQQTFEQLQEKVAQYEVVSFDIFDTLVMRKVFMPQDIFKLVERRIQLQMGLELDFYQSRLTADLTCNDKHMLLDAIYNEINQKWNLPQEVLESIKQIEIDTELECCVPRQDMVNLCNKVARSKEVYLISDMYLPLEVIDAILRKCGIQKVQDIWISGEKKKNKKSGELWENFSLKIVKGRRAFHIGDNPISDIEMPRQYGIDAYYVMGSATMWEKSSLGEFVPQIQTLEQSVFAGMLGSQIYNSPFALSGDRGMVCFKDFWQLGYCLWGGIIYSFLVWMVRETRSRNLDRLFFLARDGYLLKEDYLYLKELCQGDDWPETFYLAISRRVVLISTYQDEPDLDRIIDVPYNGTFEQFLDDRFNIQVLEGDIHAKECVSIPGDSRKVREWIVSYRNQILTEIKSEKENYLAYISQFAINERDGLIDLWFYGNNQYYLSKIVGKSLTGFYFLVNLTEGNECNKNNLLIPCFQKKDDLEARNSNLKKGDIFIESFLTAPYGMIKAVDKEGNYKCAAGGMNQAYFSERNIMNQGVCEFMKDYIGLVGKCACLPPQFIDSFFGEYIKGHLELDTEVKKVFYYDNAFVHWGESKVFE